MFSSPSSLLRCAIFISLVVFSGLFKTSEAGLLAYTSRAAFDSAATSGVSVDNYDSYAAANVASGVPLGGVTYSYDFGSLSLRVVDSIVTSSGTKSLGTNDRDMLLDGDNLNLAFPPTTGLGLYVISRDALLNGDVRLTVGATSASLDAAAIQLNLGTGNGSAWFIGIQSDDGSLFSTASVTSHGGGGLFNYNLDDLVTVLAVPEPSSISLIAIASVIGMRHRRRGRGSIVLGFKKGSGTLIVRKSLNALKALKVPAPFLKQSLS